MRGMTAPPKYLALPHSNRDCLRFEMGPSDWGFALSSRSRPLRFLSLHRIDIEQSMV